MNSQLPSHNIELSKKKPSSDVERIPSDGPRNPRDRKEGKRYIKTTEDQSKSTFEIIGTALSWFMVIITFPISIFICYFRVDEYDRAIIFRLGRVRKNARGPGLVWHLPCIDSYRLVDLRTRVEVIPSQDAITKDSVTISIDAVLFYCIKDSMHATIQISNVHESTLFIAQTTLRNMVGSLTLHELLISRQILSEKITIAVDHATEKWGVKIERVELKDISLPESLERSLASEAEALRDARAKIILAEGELNASKALKEASDVMAENKIALQLRHLQILSSIAQERNVKILYPFPLEMMKPFENSNRKKGGAAVGFGSIFPILSSREHNLPKEQANNNKTNSDEAPISSSALCLASNIRENIKDSSES
ncbi:band 7 protein AGAP004871-like isoform X1 [Drosophila nasuta]|uniref:band 7 protein AGAP004871-like isoform X1 n=1 Tax=Drosophila nasuta TaxID=42062 RepID=UPI00295E2C73|nr:band 7 protein AGAP004871-like isoform X1 [Drosophila nasuta]XP_060649226.1 band 7 protein AGAP004871-like isoform X1 [Drosophila nasuta]